MKKAFTMLELVMVIVVVGILAAVIIPRTQSNNLREAAIQLISHIRYTQHLAMVDDKFGDNSPSLINWYKKRWQIIFTNTTSAADITYSIYSDSATTTGNADESEIAFNPGDSSKILSGGSNTFSSANPKANRKLNLTATYNITSFNMSGGCNNQVRLTFDSVGRPIEGVIHTMIASYSAANLLVDQCRITLGSNDGNITIAIEPETGYAHIL